jgi:hypothetical protein
MFGLDPDVGGSALRLWVAAGSAALLVFVCALAFDWTRTRTVARVSVVVVGAILGGTLAWAFLNAAGTRDRAAERRGLETRAAELNVQALQPGSPLACLDGLSGDNVEAACERALFASPVSVATATTYVAARLALLADMTTYVQRGGGNIDNALVPLRRGLETDRFGFVARALAARDGCTSDKCKALSLLSDASKVRANLSGQTLDRYVDHYLTAWSQAPGTPVADAGSMSAPVAPGQVAAQTPDPNAPHKPVKIDFPSADSIPAVSIMTPEPKAPITPQSVSAAVNAGQQSSAKVAGPMTMPPMPGQPGAEKVSANNSGKEAASREAGKESSKGKRKQAANPPAQGAPQTTASAPQQNAPAVDPIWNPGATLASPQPAPRPAAVAPAAAPAPAAAAPAAAAPAAAAPAAAPAASAGGGGVPLAGMPVQLTPFAPQGGAAQ